MKNRDQYSSLPRPSHSLISRMGPDESIEGGYRFQSAVRKQTTDGVGVWHVKLADRSGVLNAYVHCNQATDVIPTLPTNLLVYAAIKTRLFNSRLVADLVAFDPFSDDPQPQLALDRLPRPAASSREVLDTFAELVKGMHAPVLRHALELFLMNDMLAISWIGADDHLFERSVASAAIALELPGLSREERELIMLACLLRNVGSLPMFDDWVAQYGMAFPIPEAFLTIERCAPALQWLDTTAPKAGRDIRQLLCLGHASFSDQTPMSLVRGFEFATQLGTRDYPQRTVPVCLDIDASDW